MPLRGAAVSARAALPGVRPYRRGPPHCTACTPPCHRMHRAVAGACGGGVFRAVADGRGRRVPRCPAAPVGRWLVGRRAARTVPSRCGGPLPCRGPSRVPRFPLRSRPPCGVRRQAGSVRKRGKGAPGAAEVAGRQKGKASRRSAPAWKVPARQRRRRAVPTRRGGRDSAGPRRCRTRGSTHPVSGPAPPSPRSRALPAPSLPACLPWTPPAPAPVPVPLPCPPCPVPVPVPVPVTVSLSVSVVLWAGFGLRVLVVSGGRGGSARRGLPVRRGGPHVLLGGLLLLYASRACPSRGPLAAQACAAVPGSPGVVAERAGEQHAPLRGGGAVVAVAGRLPPGAGSCRFPQSVIVWVAARSPQPAARSVLRRHTPRLAARSTPCPAPCAPHCAAVLPRLAAPAPPYPVSRLCASSQPYPAGVSRGRAPQLCSVLRVLQSVAVAACLRACVPACLVRRGRWPCVIAGAAGGRVRVGGCGWGLVAGAGRGGGKGR
ncbi:hypothetical protein QFZ75_008264 [Streptomyces sp. V3I8]|nr:hypothetical protein [Streptomyces sp. V3I8]